MSLIFLVLLTDGFGAIGACGDSVKEMSTMSDIAASHYKMEC